MPYRIITLAVNALLVAACSGSASPDPNTKASETEIAGHVFAALTASAPKDTSIPKEKNTPQATAIPKPSSTRQPTPFPNFGKVQESLSAGGVAWGWYQSNRQMASVNF